MLTVYCRRGGRIVADRPIQDEPLPDGIVWADLLEPTREDIAQIKRIAGIDVPTPEEMREIEPSSRLYRDGLALFMTARVLNHAETPDPETRAITCVLADGMMTTIRYCSPTPFMTFQSRIQTQPELCSSAEMALVEPLDAIVDRIADTLESVDAHVSALSKTILPPLEAPRDSTEAFKTIRLTAVRCSTVAERLLGLSRLLTFFDA